MDMTVLVDRRGQPRLGLAALSLVTDSSKFFPKKGALPSLPKNEVMIFWNGEFRHSV